MKLLVAEAGAPVNVLFRPGSPPLAELPRLGVARAGWRGSASGDGLHAAVLGGLAARPARVAAGDPPYDGTGR